MEPNDNNSVAPDTGAPAVAPDTAAPAPAEPVAANDVAEPAPAEASADPAVVETPAEPAPAEATPVVVAEPIAESTTEPAVEPAVTSEPAAEPITPVEPITPEATPVESAPADPATASAEPVTSAPEVVNPEMGGPVVPSTAAPEPATTDGATPVAPEAANPDQASGTTVTPADNPVVPTPADNNPVVPDSTVQPRKSKKGMLIGIIAAVAVVLGGGITAIVMGISNNSPEKIALDAATKLISSKSTNITGTLELTRSTMLDNEDSVTYVTPGSDMDFFYDTISIELESSKNGLPNTTEAKIKLKSSTLNGYDIDMSLGEALTADGSIYIKLSSLQALYDKFSTMFTGSAYETVVKQVGELISEVDGTWWRILVPELITQSFATYGMEDEAKEYKKAYECSFNTFDRLLSDSAFLADSYKKHPFISIEKADGKFDSFSGDAYSLKFNNKDMVGFINEGINSSYMNDVKTCWSTFGSSPYEISTISEDSVSNLATIPKLFVDIKDRTIQGIYINHVNETIGIKADLRINYDEKTVEAPKNSKPASELYEKVQEIFTSAMSSFYMNSSGFNYSGNVTDCDVDGETNCQTDFFDDYDEDDEDNGGEVSLHVICPDGKRVNSYTDCIVE